MFFNLDWAGGGGPEVEVPIFVVDVPLVSPSVGLVAVEADTADAPVVLLSLPKGVEM